MNEIEIMVALFIDQVDFYLFCNATPGMLSFWDSYPVIHEPSKNNL